MDYCSDCPLRLYNDKGCCINGVGSTIYGKMIVLPSIDKQAYKYQDMDFSAMVDCLKEMFKNATGDNLLDSVYITSFIKCKETKNVTIDNSIISRCRKYFNTEMFNYKPKHILLLGKAFNWYTNMSIDRTQIIIHGNYHLCNSYSPGIKLYNPDKLKDLSEDLIKWYYSNFNNYINYEKIYI